MPGCIESVLEISGRCSIVCFTIIAVLIFSVCRSPAETVVSIDADLQYRYAEHLFSKKEYITAINEYQRFIFLFPKDDRRKTAMYQIGMAYYFDGQFKKAVTSFNDFIDAVGDGSAQAVKAYFMVAESHERIERTGAAVTALHNLITVSDDPDVRDEAYYRIGWILLDSASWEEAESYFEKISEKNRLKYRLTDMEKRLQAYDDSEAKSPKLAGILSIIPGGGYLYCGRYQDALISFLLNGGLIFAAYEAFDEEMYALGGVISFVEIGFYSGNIYGSVSSAHKYNHDRDRSFIDHLKKNIKINLSSGEMNQGLALSLRYQF